VDRWSDDVAENDAARVLATLRRMTELQAQVCYMNVDRTLATWTRTALTLIVFGFVVDHFGLLLAPNPVSSIGGVILIALGVFIVAAAAIRHQAYMARWNRVYRRPGFHGPWLALTFAAMVAVFGTALLAILLYFVQ
jgi:putative membrane protein